MNRQLKTLFLCVAMLCFAIKAEEAQSLPVSNKENAKEAQSLTVSNKSRQKSLTLKQATEAAFFLAINIILLNYYNHQYDLVSFCKNSLTESLRTYAEIHSKTCQCSRCDQERTKRIADNNLKVTKHPVLSENEKREIAQKIVFDQNDPFGLIIANSELGIVMALVTEELKVTPDIKKEQELNSLVHSIQMLKGLYHAGLSRCNGDAEKIRNLNDEFTSHKLARLLNTAKDVLDINY